MSAINHGQTSSKPTWLQGVCRIIPKVRSHGAQKGTNGHYDMLHYDTLHQTCCICNTCCVMLRYIIYIRRDIRSYSCTVSQLLARRAGTKTQSANLCSSQRLAFHRILNYRNEKDTIVHSAQYLLVGDFCLFLWGRGLVACQTLAQPDGQRAPMESDEYPPGLVSQWNDVHHQFLRPTTSRQKWKLASLGPNM